MSARDMARDTLQQRALAPLFHRFLDRIDAGLERGGIEARLPDDTHRLLGGRKPGPVPIVTLHRWRALVRLATGGSVGWYRAWADGDWSSPDPVPLFDLFMRNRLSLAGTARAGGLPKLLLRGWHALRRNDRDGARRNIADHYDLGNDFYGEWLDPSLTYSSGIYAAGDDLPKAQARKLAAILDRTRTALRTASDRVRARYGFACTAAAAQLAEIEEVAAASAGGDVRVVAMDPAQGPA